MLLALRKLRGRDVRGGAKQKGWTGIAVVTGMARCQFTMTMVNGTVACMAAAFRMTRLCGGSLAVVELQHEFPGLVLG